LFLVGIVTATEPVVSEYPAVAQVRPRRGLFSGPGASDNITGWLFVSPAVILIFIFGLFPIGYAFYMSLHNWR
jgi:multiple sugar transport system permease protein